MNRIVRILIHLVAGDDTVQMVRRTHIVDGGRSQVPNRRVDPQQVAHFLAELGPGQPVEVPHHLVDKHQVDAGGLVLGLALQPQVKIGEQRALRVEEGEIAPCVVEQVVVSQVGGGGHGVDLGVNGHLRAVLAQDVQEPVPVKHVLDAVVPQRLIVPVVRRRGVRADNVPGQDNVGAGEDGEPDEVEDAGADVGHAAARVHHVQDKVAGEVGLGTGLLEFLAVVKVAAYFVFHPLPLEVVEVAFPCRWFA